MKLRTIWLTNFRSFRSTQKFDFPDGPGLYFMWGDNQAEPRLEGNGAGKSSLWKALTWLFFEKTSEGLKAGDACNWGAAKGTSVKLEFCRDDGIPEFVERTWKPNTWVLRDLFGNVTDLVKDPSNPVLALLRLEFSSFLYSILMAQGQPMFLDLKSEGKASVFAEVMGLDRWLEYSARASDAAKTASETTRQLTSQRDRLLGQLQQAEDFDVNAKMRQWETGREQRLAGLEREYVGLLDRRDTLLITSAAKQAEAEKVREALKGAVAALRAAKVALEEAKERGSGEGTHACPTCGAGIDHGMRRLIDNVAAAERKVRTAQDDISHADASARGAERDIASIDKTLDNLEDREDAIKAEKNPYESMQDDHETRVQQTRGTLDTVTKRLDAASARFSIASEWVRWFKEIRLGLMSEALDQLEMEVNSCVTELGLVDWELRFDVDKETAKGTLQRGFTASVISPHNPKPVPWEAWSGGESQRLRLAANMGLSNLTRARTGTPLNMEVWDEPTQFLSPQGVTDLLDTLAARAQTERRQIWIVDHRTLGYAGFTQSFGVVKTEAGSHFVKGPAYSSEHAAPQRLKDATSRTAHDVLRRRARTS